MGVGNPWLWAAVAIVALGYGSCDLYSKRAVSRPPGIVAAAEPSQRMLPDAPRALPRLSGADIAAVAEFRMTARVLGVERYRFDRMSKWAPVDLAFGWGPMSDSSVLAKLDVSQGNRFYFWSTREFPIARGDIERNSANMHLVAADPGVARRIAGARTGQLATLSGYLINIKADDGWSIASSLSREDTGSGACEVIWVESFDVE